MEVEKCNELVDNENNETVKQNMTTSAAMSTTSNSLNGWHQSRIIRVSRASGGKDRHSKVWTSKGLRDRRVRLSVQTAIQFYDLQDRLGYDQPSKAVEWLIKAAADAIAELPSLNAPSLFPDTPKQQQLSDEKKKRKARERARDRTAKDKEVEIEIGTTNNNAETFTELLATGIGSNINNCNTGHNSNQMGYSFGFPQSTLFSIDNLNLSALSSSGFNGGTLQSNTTTSSSLSPLPLLNHLQRFSQPLESSVPFFFGAAESHQQHQFPAGLQLYGDHKGKPKHSSLFSENRSEKSNGSCKRMHMLPSSDVSLL